MYQHSSYFVNFMRISALALIIPLLFSLPAHAQSSDERIDQLEQELLLMKKRQERSANAMRNAPSDNAGIGNAHTDVRITALEEELRALRGKLEEKEFETQKLAGEMQKFKLDTEFRLTEMEKLASAAAAAPATPAAEAPESTLTPSTIEKAGARKKPEVSVKEVPTDLATGQPVVLPPKTEDPIVPNDKPPAAAGDTPRDHYNYAFRLLNQNQYEQASKSFADFTKKYPKDPLVGNAYYWQGETYYIRKDYGNAVDNFRKGFEAMPKGPKAADNLLKLGMSLAAQDKKKDACVVLQQVMTRYKAASATVAAKAEAEHKRVGCE